MLVKMLVDISGTRDGKPWPPHGHMVDLPEEEARSLVAVGSAEYAPAQRPVESAAVDTEPEQVRGLTKASMSSATVPMRPVPSK